MTDELDAMLQGQEDTTAPVSQTQTEGQPNEPGEPLAPGQQTAEEVEFNKLTGSTQDRIKKLVQDKRELLKRLESNQTPPPPPPPPGYRQLTPDVQDAVRKLSDVGIATKDEVKDQIDNSLAQLRYDYEINRLEGRYTGDNGEPKFVREEYEDYLGQHPQFRNYLPEDVYRKMYQEELLDIEVQKHINPQARRTRTLKPTRTQTQQESLTPESIEERLKQPDGQQWYNDNVEKINAVLKGQSQ